MNYRGCLSGLVAIGSALLTGCGVESTTVHATPGGAVPPVAHVDADGAEKLLKEGKHVVLDIRTPAEFAAGHVAGATNLNFNTSDFEAKVALLDRTQPYLVHCAVGGRSQRSLAVFQKLGFTSIAHLDGGYQAWKAAGKPVTK